MIGRLLLTLGLLGLCSVTESVDAMAAQSGSIPPGTVVVLTWSDALDPNLIRDFRRQTGLRVLVDAYAAPDDVPRALRAAKPAYDLALFPLDLLRSTVKAGVLAQIDPVKVPAGSGLNPDLVRQVASQDPGGPHALPFDWYPTGIAFNAARLKAQHVVVDPANGWDPLFKPELLRSAAACGVGVPERPGELYATALTAFGRDPLTPNALDGRRALAGLAQLRLNTKKQSNADLVEGLAGGTLCLAMVPAPDVAQAVERARGAGNGVKLSFALPAQGGPLSVDVLAVPNNAPNVDGALKLIAFLLRPENAVRAARFVHAASALANPPSTDSNAEPALFDDYSVLSKLFLVPDYDASLKRAIDAEWARGKAR
jgi:putrescine transport system substrate-binding protein